jgi:ESS family glutamate:Na+ symporter
MVTIQLDIAQTIGIAAILLVVGEFIKKRVDVLARYFIPGPIIGGLVFSVIALVGHQTGLFAFEFYDNMRAFFDELTHHQQDGGDADGLGDVELDGDHGVSP